MVELTTVDPLAEVIEMPSGMFFDEKGRLITARLGEVIRQAGHVRKSVDKRLWRYQGGAYRSDGEEFARGQVRELLGDDFKRAHLGEVVSWLDSFPPTIGGDPLQGLLNVANGLLELDTLKLRPHDPEVLSTTQIPVAWGPDAACPKVEAFLDDVLPSDSIGFVEEIVGYALLPTNIMQKAVMLFGPAGTGKSKLLGLIGALVGPGNLSAVSLQDLGEKRFHAALLHGRLANLCGDIDSRTIRAGGLFKQITGGDRIQAEHKFCPPFEFVSYALPIFSANQLPLSEDQSLAWFDRWLVIPMDHRFRGTEAEDERILDKLAQPDELEGLLKKAVHGARRLMERGRFELPPSVSDATTKYRDRLDSARAFLEECCVEHPNAWTPRSVVFSQYKTWCKGDDRPYVRVEVFNDYLRKNTGATEVTHRGTRGWSGLGLLSDGYQ